MEVVHPLQRGDYMGFMSNFLHYLQHYCCEQALRVSLCLPVLEKDGAFCCTALSSRRRRSSSDRLLPRAEVMAVDDESECFCLLGKLDKQKCVNKGLILHYST